MHTLNISYGGKTVEKDTGPKGLLGVHDLASEV